MILRSRSVNTHAPDVALDHDDLLPRFLEVLRVDQEFVERREQVAPVLDDAPIAALKAAADLALRRVQLDLGIEELRGRRRISFENLLKAIDVDGRKTSLRIQSPDS
jgi:hypothetical protein